ncbi:hypothetical protein L2E82_41037 [Cichorium intybus]|uniref:Uncharacterized protein n=1 Tax=Cichorium intybus TaxID=13427 RepID=A0ACB9ANE1_CICIN|nr:hypothetical protein L2E82_41037 [Cichorium intybus]
MLYDKIGSNHRFFLSFVKVIFFYIEITPLFIGIIKIHLVYIDTGNTEMGILTICFKLPVSMISPWLYESFACVTASLTSKSWVPSGTMVNHGGFSSTATPVGGTTAHTYVSTSLATFLTVLLTIFDPLSDEMVTEGTFRSDGALKECEHGSPIAVLMKSGSVFGIEHKKLI